MNGDGTCDDCLADGADWGATGWATAAEAAAVIVGFVAFGLLWALLEGGDAAALALYPDRPVTSRASTVNVTNSPSERSIVPCNKTSVCTSFEGTTRTAPQYPVLCRVVLM